MGCFDSTCSVTKTPVHVGDEVLMVCIQDQPGIPNLTGIGHARGHASTYEMLQDFYLDREREDRPEWMAKPEVERERRLKFHGYVMLFGIYNDYGWLEDVPKKETAPSGERFWEGDNEFKFFVHKSVVDRIVGSDSKALPIIDVVEKVSKFAWSARVELFHHHLLGEQYGVYSKQEKEAHQLLIELTQLAHDFAYESIQEEGVNNA